MNTKWYVGALLIILALVGLSQKQAKVANQQIVLQLTAAEMTSATALDDALITITSRLETLGISNIEILENNTKQLTIRYYSDYDALRVEEYLSDTCELSVRYSKHGEFPFDFPKDQLPESYKLVVLDIQQQTGDGLGLNTTLAFASNKDFKPYSNPMVFSFNTAIVLQQNAILKVAYKINSANAIVIENTSTTIPEVRAGPFTYRNS